MPEHTLKDKIVVIGGGAKNLGGLISRTLAADGAKIVVHYNSDSTKAVAEETVKAIKAAGSERRQSPREMEQERSEAVAGMISSPLDHSTPGPLKATGSHSSSSQMRTPGEITGPELES